MLVYIGMLLVSLGFSIISERMKNKKIHFILAVLSGVPFTLISALRYDVGTDYLYRYVHDFEMLKSGKNVNNLEIGFLLLDKLCIGFDIHYQCIFIITSIIINIFIFYTIYKQSKNVWLSIFIYFAGAFYFQSLNMVRQYIAISIVLFSCKFLLDKKWIKWAISIIIAMLFHVSVLVFAIISLIIVLWDNKKEIKIFTNYKLILGLIILLFFGETVIRNVIYLILEATRFKTYIGSVYDYGDLQILPFIINSLIYIGMVIVMLNKKELDKFDRFYIGMQICALIFLILGKTTMLSLRFVYYFSIIQVVSIPYFLDSVKVQLGKKKYIIVICSLIIILLLSVVWTHVVHTSDEILPYKSIFNKEYEIK